MKSLRHPLILIAILLLTACSKGAFNTPNASGYYMSKPMQCVPFARNASGLNIYGDAHSWWDKAARSHARGQIPHRGAVLVLASTRKLRRGHLAVVKDVLGPRDITVTHTNWGSDFNTRRVAYESMRVEDISSLNNWSLLRFWNKDISAFGHPYKASGFIYP